MAKIVVIGTGNVGSGIRQAAAAQHHEVVSLNTSSQLEDGRNAIASADFIFIAIPFAAVVDLPQGWKDETRGRIVVDATNPLTADFANLTVGFSDSAGEQVAAALPGAQVVKALNAVLAPNQDPSAFPTGSIFVPVAGEESAAKSVTDLLNGLGFDAQVVGDLSCSRYLEPLAELMIHLAYMEGQGTGIALQLMRA
ncbi:NADPH-dependent F420 reductase [Bombiscardovia nodaiensis]|uniref:NADPH-dependent F420 reductase n=1 Tax=Bombiscardovia nodaiensis TaxID=2932181 RepID=A0ABN6SBM2_9BIFI|nr:NADPH-dependent F420 reductase [Bombiscardovia nodaiensis]